MDFLEQTAFYLNPHCFEFQIIHFKTLLLVFWHCWHSCGCSISYAFSKYIRTGL